jgi:hypothetical protein
MPKTPIKLHNLRVAPSDLSNYDVNGTAICRVCSDNCLLGEDRITGKVKLHHFFSGLSRFARLFRRFTPLFYFK